MPKTSAARLFKQIAGFPFFILLIGVYPVLFLLAANLNQTAIQAIGISLLVSVVAALLISAICLVVIRPRSRAYLALVVLNLAFFSYGHLFNLVDGRSIGGFLIGRHMLFLPVFLAVILGALLLVLRRPAPRQASAWLYNVTLSILCLFQIVPIAANQVSTGQLAREEARVASAQVGEATATAAAPDIYYIVLDGLPREELIRDQYGFEAYNLPQELEKRGFVIPDCAFSNYNSTATSITSALNFEYLDTLGIPDEQINNDVNDPPVLYNLLHNNRLVGYLKERGYTFVSFRGFFPLNDFKEADVYFNFFENQQGFDDLAERNFRSMFLRTTLLRLLVELYEGRPEAFPFIPQAVAQVIAPDASVFSSRSYQWYQQHLYNFEMLETVPALPGKKFTYAHFYTTHQPYVLRPDGSLLWPINEDNDGFVAAVQYTSTRILEVVDRILADSSTPPVIIIQADHGQDTGLARHKILNAYYLPGVDPAIIEETITPVNSFRIVLNQYAGGNFPLLPDVLLLGSEEPGPFDRREASCELK